MFPVCSLVWNLVAMDFDSTSIRKSRNRKSGKVQAIDGDYTGLSPFVLERDYFRPWMKGDSTAPARLLA